MWEICCGDLLYVRLCVRFTFIGPKKRRDVDAAHGSVKNPSFIANFSRARTRFCIALNYEEPSDKRWNIYILFWILNKTGDTLRARARIPVRICRFQAVGSADARSSEMIILDAIIWIMRDASHRVEIRTARSQDNELRSKRVHLLPPSSLSLFSAVVPVVASVVLVVAGMSTKKQSLTPSFTRRRVKRSI